MHHPYERGKARTSPPAPGRASTPAVVSRGTLSEVILLFLRLGLTAFGGPAAHIAMMRDEVVTRRHWLTDQEFLDLVGATNLIPGPNSTEMAIHVGYRRAGRAGLIAAGAAFIIPAMMIVLALSWAYTRYGTTPQAAWLLYGVKPVIMAVVVQALWGLGRVAVKDLLTGAVGVGVLALYLSGAHEILLLLAAGLAVMAARNLRGRRQAAAGLVAALANWRAPVADAASAAYALGAVTAVGAVSAALPQVFLIFLKIGSVLYGSGYVLLAFLRADFVHRLGWLTEAQLLDGIAIGQFTPGPVFTTATFIGYVLAGLPGAIVATVGIFLPGFAFVAASHAFVPRMRRSPWAGALLDGVNAASLALMAGVTWQLGRSALVDGLTLALAAAALVSIARFRINSAWLVAAGALVGLLSRALSGAP